MAPKTRASKVAAQSQKPPNPDPVEDEPPPEEGRKRKRTAEKGGPGGKRAREVSPAKDAPNGAAELEMEMEPVDEDDGMDYDEDFGGDDSDAGSPRRASLTSPLVQPIPLPETQPQWLETLERCVKSIVAIRFSQVAAFDTDQAGNSEVGRRDGNVQSG